MPHCGGSVECTEDAITFDDLTDEDCVSFNETEDENACVSCETSCTSCETAAAIRNADRKTFDKDPVKKLFAKHATRAQTAKIRELLKQKCNIDSKEPDVELLQKLFVFDEADINRFVDKIQQKLNVKQQKKFKKYIQLLLKTLQQTTNWNKLIANNAIESEDVLQTTMKNDMLDLIADLDIHNIGFAHNPRSIVSAAYSFLQRASESPHTKLMLALNAMATNTACFEGVVGLAENLLYE